MPQIIRRKSKPKLFQCLLGTGKSRSAEDIRYIGIDVQDMVISRRNKSGMEQSPDDNNNAKPADVPRIFVNDHDVQLCQRHRSDKATWQCLTSSERYK